MEQILAISIVLGLLMGSLWWLRRSGMARFTCGLPAGRARRNLELVERLPLAPQHSLHLVRIGPRTLLIGVSPSGCALLESRETESGTTAKGELG